ncbi:elongation factor 1-beta [Candidatus Woesearchaeota archaeon]|nr:elongation factor 1-beta [Candidatus Woesearchaeota archaeon]
MGTAIITLKIMPTSPEESLEGIQEQAISRIKEFAGDIGMKAEVEPVAFGLNALRLTFPWDEKKGSTDEVEASLAGIAGVESVLCVDVRRAIG